MTLGNILGGMITRLVVALINLFILVISARYLGAATRGEISLYLLNIALVQLINEIYTGYAIIHFVPRFDSRRLIAGGIIVTIILVPLLNAVIGLAGKQVEGFGGLALITSLLVVLNTFCCVLLLGRQRVALFNLLSLLQPLLLLGGLCIGFFVLGIFTLEAFVWPLFFSFLLALSCSAIALLRLPGIEGKFHLRELLKQGLYYQGAVIMFLLANRFSYYLLADAHKLGVYSAATSIMDAALLLAAGMAPALLSRMASEKDPFQGAALTLALAKLSSLITLCCILIVLVVPPGFFTALLGEGFTGLRQAMMAYSPGLLLASFMICLTAFFTATGKQRIVLYCYGLGFLCTLLVAPVLVNRLQVTGAAFSAGISYLVMTIFIVVAFTRQNEISPSRLFALRADFNLLLKLIRKKAP